LKNSNQIKKTTKIAGFPTREFEMWAKKFLLQGYKVIRIDQKAGQKKNVEREVGTYLSGGTLLDPFLLESNQSNYLLSIYQHPSIQSHHSKNNNDNNNNSAKNNGSDNNDGSNNNKGKKGENQNAYYNFNLFKKEEEKKLFGVTIIEVTVGEIYLGWFWDDSHLSILQTLALQFQAKEVLYDPQNLSSSSLLLLKNISSSLVFTSQNFWDQKKTFHFLTSPFLQNQSSLRPLVANKIDLSFFQSFQSSYWRNPQSLPSLLSSLLNNSQSGNLGFSLFFLFQFIF
jgi:DNA mismatch repair ATPase MutS